MMKTDSTPDKNMRKTIYGAFSQIKADEPLKQKTLSYLKSITENRKDKDKA